MYKTINVRGKPVAWNSEKASQKERSKGNQRWNIDQHCSFTRGGSTITKKDSDTVDTAVEKEIFKIFEDRNNVSMSTHISNKISCSFVKTLRFEYESFWEAEGKEVAFILAQQIHALTIQ